jgi:hypothetical protein
LIGRKDVENLATLKNHLALDISLAFLQPGPGPIVPRQHNKRKDEGRGGETIRKISPPTMIDKPV